jgi:hypothetical protein
MIVQKQYHYIDTSEDFTRWATHAKRNDRIVYYKGLLMRDRQLNENLLGNKEGDIPQFRTANKALEFSDLGIVKLFQKRHGEGDYSYIAVKA